MIENLTLTSESPLPDDFDDYFTCGLAIRLAPRYCKRVAAETVQGFRRMETKIRAQYHQDTPAPSGGDQLIQSEQAYGGGAYDLFNPAQ